MSAVLEVSGVGKEFGGIKALSDVSLLLPEGEIHGILGPNGSGKTTLFNVVSGFLPATSGDVKYRGTSICRWSPHRIAGSGLARTFQLVHSFSGMSGQDVLDMAMGSKRAKQAARSRGLSAASIAEELGIGSRLSQRAENMQAADLRLLDIARALATAPDALLLDEPFSSLSMEETERVSQVVRQLRAGGVSVLIVEHNLGSLMRLIDRATVLNFGRVIAVGSPTDVVQNRDVIRAYLGADDEPEGNQSTGDAYASS